MSDEQEIQGKNKLGNKKYLLFFGIVIIAIVAGVLIYEALKYETTDDAYVDTTTVTVSPKVAGQIIQVNIKDNQPVKAGDVVAVIDRVDYKVKLDQANAAYKRALLNQQNAYANFNASSSEIELAKKDVERYQRLYEAGAVSKQTLDKAITNLDSKKAKHMSDEQSIFSSNPNNATKVADADLNILKAQQQAAQLAYDYTEVKAPIDGTVSGKKVEVGMMVQPGSPLFVIVPNDVWVVANFKETQLKGMKKDTPVDIKIDAYPKKVFKGKIDSIQRASGAKSSLFPPENAVGSFVKIVQRIPVKIVFTEEIDPEEYQIIPGMSVVPKVKVR